MAAEVKGPDDMVVVDGLRVRPEDEKQVEERQQALRDAEDAAVDAAQEVGMVVIDGVQYRPEDAPKADSSKKAGAVTTKAAQPRNKARTASNK